MPFEDDNWCFACGKSNPAGLGMAFSSEKDGTVKATFTAGKHLQGFDGAVHGGIVATLLDEALAHAVNGQYGFAVTAELSVRFRNITPTDAPLEICGLVKTKKFQMVTARAWICNSDGKITAEALGKFMLVSQSDREKASGVMSSYPRSIVEP